MYGGYADRREPAGQPEYSISNVCTIKSVGQRGKAEQALAAWKGERPSFGERADATAAAAAGAQAAVGEVMGAGPAPQQPAPPQETGAGRPLPLPGSAGSWVWVTLPHGTGEVCARAVRWIRVTPTELAPSGWALVVTWPCWQAITSYTGAAGLVADEWNEYQTVPSTRVEPIPGLYTGVPRER